MSITKKLRFEVFKRDGFRCAYCGKEPPLVVLEVDHVEPKSKGGKDDISNLITACFDCNRGKKHIPLDKIPGQISENLEVLKEKESQLTEYRKFIKKIERRQDKDIEKVNQVFMECFEGQELNHRFKRVSVKKFISSLPIHEVTWAMEAATSKVSDDPERAIRYFCGICWNKINNTE